MFCYFWLSRKTTTSAKPNEMSRLKQAGGAEGTVGPISVKYLFRKIKHADEHVPCRSRHQPLSGAITSSPVRVSGCG